MTFYIFVGIAFIIRLCRVMNLPYSSTGQNKIEVSCADDGRMVLHSSQEEVVVEAEATRRYRGESRINILSDPVC